jgi:hypothetical protein
MAFRVQDPVSGLFWEVDAGHRIRLTEKGSLYIYNTDGSIVNSDTGMPLRIAGNKVIEGDWPVKWQIVDGVISVDDEHIIQYDECSETLRVASTPASWVQVPAGASAAPEPVAVPEPEPVAVPEPEPVAVPEPEAESESASESEPEPEPEDDDEEDVPVARSAALIEEALNAQAADAEA